VLVPCRGSKRASSSECGSVCMAEAEVNSGILPINKNIGFIAPTNDFE